MITARMKDSLRGLGLSDVEIGNLTPAQAHDLINGAAPAAPRFTPNLDALAKAIKEPPQTPATPTVGEGQMKAMRDFMKANEPALDDILKALRGRDKPPS